MRVQNSQTESYGTNWSFSLHGGFAGILGDYGYEVQFGVFVALGDATDIALFLTKAPAAGGSSGLSFPPRSIRAAIAGEIVGATGNLSTDEFRSPALEAVSINLPPMPILPYGAATEVLYEGQEVRHGGGGVSAGFAATVTGPKSGLISGSGVYGIRDLYIDVLFPLGEAVNDAYWRLDGRLRGND